MIVKTLIKNLEYGQLELGCCKTLDQHLCGLNVWIVNYLLSRKCHLYITFIKFRTVLYGYQRLCVQVSHLLSCKGMQTYSSNRNIIHRFLMAYNIFIGTAWTSLKEHAVNKLSMILPKNMGGFFLFCYLYFENYSEFLWKLCRKKNATW
jgi:hypothetical protein